MEPKLGYLLPTRENVMLGNPGGRELLDGARHAQDLGFDSIWAGDSLTARPRHDPLTLLAAVAGAVDSVQLGTAVLLPALRNPVVLAQQLATIDQLSEGRLVIGAGISADTPASRAEFAAAGVPFAGRVGRFMEGWRLCRALWAGEPVDWDGRWQMSAATLAPVPYRKGGPPIWIGSTVDAGIVRTAKHFDGWFPIGPDAVTYAQRQTFLHEQAALAGRSADSLTSALYLTLSLADSTSEGDEQINRYLEAYYGVPAAMMRQIQACHGGPLEGVLQFVREFVQAGAQHLIIRAVGDSGALLRSLAEHRDELSAS